MTKCEQTLPGAWQGLGQCVKQGEYRSSVGYTLCDEHWKRLVNILTEYPVCMFKSGKRQSSLEQQP